MEKEHLNIIDRVQEAEVYSLIKDKNICDDLIYINAEKWI